MTKLTQRNIQVYADWIGLSEPTLIGELHAIQSRGKEIFSFVYDHVWLEKYSFMIDPSLQLFSGHHYANEGQGCFGIFLDSAPDRWGRTLLARREALLARQEDRKERRLLESDYLLGVFDEQRTGALRFKIEQRGPFLDSNINFATPPWASLRELEHACQEIESNNAENNPNFGKWLRMKMAGYYHQPTI